LPWCRKFFYLIHERIFKEVAKRGQVAGWAFKALMNLNRGLRAVGVNAGRIFFGKLHRTFGEKMRYLITGGSRFDPQIGYDFHALGIDVPASLRPDRNHRRCFLPHLPITTSLVRSDRLWPLPGGRERSSIPSLRKDGGPRGR